MVLKNELWDTVGVWSTNTDSVPLRILDTGRVKASVAGNEIAKLVFVITFSSGLQIVHGFRLHSCFYV